TVECGRVARPAPPPGKGINQNVQSFASPGPTLALYDFSQREGQTDYYIVVDGWRPTDKGHFEIAVTKGSVATIPSGETQAAVAGIGMQIQAATAQITDQIQAASNPSQFTRWDFAESSTRTGLREFITLASETDQM